MTARMSWPASPSDVKIGSLFSGYGGLEMGTALALGGGRTIWHCEWDKAPSRILEHHWPEVPNLHDVTTVDWTTVERVHVLTGGSPCQDVSTAGKRKGMKQGTRSGLWAAMVDAIDELRPPLVIWENVQGVTSAEATSDVVECAGCVGNEAAVYLRALGRVLGDLADLGYDAQWYGLRAADVGAPHGRFRIFVVAADAEDLGHEGAGGVRDWWAGLEDRRGPLAADAASVRRASGLRDGDEPRGSREADQLGARGERAAADPASDGRERPGAAQGAEPEYAHGDRPAAADDDGNGFDRVAGASTGRRAVRADERDDADGRGDHAATHAHGDDRGLEIDGVQEGVRARQLFQRSSAPARAGDGRRAEPADAEGDAGGIVDGDDGPAARTAEEAGIDFGPYAVAIRRWELITGQPVPSPVEWNAKATKRFPEGRYVLSPAFAEWMMGLPVGHVSSSAIKLTRAERLKACGNGVVPQQAAAAIRVCLDRMVQLWTPVRGSQDDAGRLSA